MEFRYNAGNNMVYWVEGEYVRGVNANQSNERPWLPRKWPISSHFLSNNSLYEIIEADNYKEAVLIIRMLKGT